MTRTGNNPAEKSLLRIENLSVSFDTDDGPVNAVDHVSLSVRPGEVLGLVGESGCGKSVTAMSVLRLIPMPPGRIVSGRIEYEGKDLLKVTPAELRAIRGSEIGMIFQEPMTALSPLHRVGRQLVEAVRLHRPVTQREAERLSIEWLAKVGIPDPEERMQAYPFELSGGMRQRVMIAMALMLGPNLIIADEPTTAVDVTIQAQIFDLMRRVKGQSTSVLLITHDMGAVWEMCERVAVMYASEIVELGDMAAVFSAPLHPYTEALLASMPGRVAGRRLKAIGGQVPSPLEYPSGCRFRNRCPYAFDRCAQEHPEPVEAGSGWGRCFLAAERAAKGGTP